MKQFFGPKLASLLMLLAIAAPAAQFKFPTQTLTVPDGFTVELVAGPPLVDRPISVALDEQGRLYATDSAGATEKAPEQLKTKPHRIVRLEDTDHDGRYDKSTVFATKMMFPEGALWYEGSLYVAAPPEILKLTDTDGDGVADKREAWFDGKTLTGCANDLHGPYLGRDGWFYWCKGAFAEQKYTLPNGQPFVTRASHIFRSRPDNSGIEPVLTGGMDNPVGVTFTAAGERILSCTFFQQPGGGFRDGLIHAIYGGVYGKQHDVLNGHARTGELMPVLLHMGAAAPCGLSTYDSGVFGEDYRDNLFACYFNLQKVCRHVLTPEGATFATTNIDFLVSDNPDFHPTDVVEDADGSLLIVDTGGWYKICCPTSQLWKPDVLGAIYRVRKNGVPALSDPRGLKIDWTTQSAVSLAKLLGDERLFVRRRVIHELGKRGDKALSALSSVVMNGKSSTARRNAVWVLARISGNPARELVRTALNDEDPGVVQAALQVTSLWCDKKAGGRLQSFLAGSNAQHARAAAEALGRVGDKSAVPALLDAADRLQTASGVSMNPGQRVLEHSLVYALIEIGDRTAVLNALSAKRAFAQTGQFGKEGSAAASAEEGKLPVLNSRAALIALDQMEGGGLWPGAVLPLLNSRRPLLKETAQWIIGHRPDWSQDLAGYFRERLRSESLPSDERDGLQTQIASLATDAAMQDFIASELGNVINPESSKQVLLRAMAQASVKQPPASWEPALKECLRSASQDTLRAAVASVRALPAVKNKPVNFAGELLHLARDESQPADLRVEALAAIAGGLRKVEPELFEFLLHNLAADRPPLLRTATAGVLARARLTDEQLLALTSTFKEAGSMELSTLLGAFEQTKSEAVGMKLIGTLVEAKNLLTLRADMFTTRLAKYPASVQQKSGELVKRLDSSAAEEKARLHELATTLPAGDIRRGQAIFRSEKTACATCHAIGYLGGKVGPDLTRIGQIRTEADLLESIVFPSRTFVRSYEPVLVIAKDGESYTGVIKNETADGVQLVSGPNAEQRVLRSNIAEIRPGSLSIMPGGLADQLSKQDLADLVAFLRSLK